MIRYYELLSNMLNKQITIKITKTKTPSSTQLNRIGNNKENHKTLLLV